MKRSTIYVALLALMAASCSNPSPEKKDQAYKSFIQGLASPIHLKFDSTQVFITDYFPDAKGVEKITLEGASLKCDSTTGVLLIEKNISTPIANLEVIYKGVAHDIPVFASEKVKHHFNYIPTSDKVQLVELSGSMNGWNRKATTLRKEGMEWTTDMILNPGLFQYRVWEDGKEMMDMNNPEKMDNGMGAFNNTFFAGEKQSNVPKIISSKIEIGKVHLSALDEIKNVKVYFENKLIDAVRNGNDISIDLPKEAKDLKRSHLRIFADNGKVRSNDILIPLENGEAIADASKLERSDMNASIMYFAMVDRFVDGDSTNDRPTIDAEILPQANNLGGDISGITQKIKDGYFAKLGVNTIWLSPISQNAEGAWGLWKDKTCKNKDAETCIHSKFSAYHGYWPTSLRTIDNRFGNEAQFKELIALAHQKGMNVILDYVAHHVHQDHPLYKQKPEWTTPLYLPDGRMNTELWDEQRLTTWFDTFLPTWKFANHEVVEALTDTAMFWVENYDLDGFRHDATKHIEEDFWRTLTRKVKAYKSAHPERNIYQIGETYGGPELISSYINSGELDAQFDFNLYDAEVDAFAKDNTTFENLERVMNESMHYYGSHHTMGNITGNQDRSRFISYADNSVQFSEDAKAAGWLRKIKNQGETGYQKLQMLNAFLLTTPGVPCIYYGDEIGMPGGNDPDNRRMMHFGDLDKNQQQLFDATSQLVKLRRENLALTYGDLFILKNDSDALVFVRSYFGNNVIVVFDKSVGGYENWKLQIPKEFLSANIKALMGGHFEIIDGMLSPKSAEVERKNAVEVFH